MGIRVGGSDHKATPKMMAAISVQDQRIHRTNRSSNVGHEVIVFISIKVRLPFAYIDLYSRWKIIQSHSVHPTTRCSRCAYREGGGRQRQFTVLYSIFNPDVRMFSPQPCSLPASGSPEPPLAQLFRQTQAGSVRAPVFLLISALTTTGITALIRSHISIPSANS